ncbi:MAG: class I SAM-dependent methyltransferase [Bosea sp. (in: a-proteobacteria)]
MSWREFWNGEHAIYVNARHMALHYKRIADDIVALLPSRNAVVLDHGSGEALSADRIAAHCGKLILCDSAPNVRARIVARAVNEPKISAIAPEEIEALADNSLDLVVANSLLQYLSRDELKTTLALWQAKLKPGGTLVVADILPPDLSPLTDAKELLIFAFKGGFLVAALIGLVRTALSDYRRIRATLGLSSYSEADITTLLTEAGFLDVIKRTNLGHNPHRMCFAARAAV